MKEVDGSNTNGAQPYVQIWTSSNKWQIEVGFIFTTNFPGHTWLKITNHVGAKLELWQTNGVKIISKNTDVRDALRLPKHTLSTEILQHSGRPKGTGAYQWLEAGFTIPDGDQIITADFSLSSAFDVAFTNDYVLNISPLIYKVETNLYSAHLVEFPPFKIRLNADGSFNAIK